MTILDRFHCTAKLSSIVACIPRAHTPTCGPCKHPHLGNLFSHAEGVVHEEVDVKREVRGRLDGEVHRS